MKRIPTEFSAFRQTHDTNRNYHALLMVLVWMILVPPCITIMRFHKPPPSEKGIVRDVSLWHRDWWFFNVHKISLFFAIVLAFGGTALAWIASGRFRESVHTRFGTIIVLLGIAQINSSQLRGTYSGKKNRQGADPGNPDTWRSNLCDHTAKRRMCESVYNTTGYFTLLFTFGAVGSGLMRYHMPSLMAAFILIILVWLAAWATCESKGRAYDGYRVAHGHGLEHPYNKAR